eukprot:1143389-Pelagomonas_calceolata.AAC.1
MKERETHWLRRAASPLHHEATDMKVLMGILRVTGSTWLQNLAVRGIMFSIARLVVTSLLAYKTEWACSLQASLVVHWWSRKCSYVQLCSRVYALKAMTQAPGTPTQKPVHLGKVSYLAG